VVPTLILFALLVAVLLVARLIRSGSGD